MQALPLDLADPASITAGAAQAGALLGGLDGQVNNGAIGNLASDTALWGAPRLLA